MRKKYYDKKYFSWQNSIGEFGGRANLIKFESHIKPTDTVVDFGCGGGYLLANIACRQKMGIDINATARRQAKKMGIQTVADASKIKSNWADVVISNNTLEHTKNPLQHVVGLHRILKKNGRIICIVPCDSQGKKFVLDDINKHFFSWSPMNAGNLFSEAGFKVIKVSPYLHKWPPFYTQIEKLFGLRVFHSISYVYGFIARDWVQVKIEAVKR
jgi:SAM-dependent methyltransferase